MNLNQALARLQLMAKWIDGASNLSVVPADAEALRLVLDAWHDHFGPEGGCMPATGKAEAVTDRLRCTCPDGYPLVNAGVLHHWPTCGRYGCTPMDRPPIEPRK